MKKQKTCLLVLLLAFLLLLGRTANAKEAAAGEIEVRITILSTSDIHGMVYNYDYAADSTTQNGLVKAAAVIREEREKDPDLLLADCGDTLQGNLISSFRNLTPHPGIRAMNLLHYDTWTIGNHEFDYEFDALSNAIASSNAAVLGANIYKPDGKRFLAPYIIKEVKGVRVALFGITSPHVPRWVSDSSKYASMIFSNPMEETDKILKELDVAAQNFCQKLLIYLSKVFRKYFDKTLYKLRSFSTSLLNFSGTCSRVFNPFSIKLTYIFIISLYHPFIHFC